MITNNKKNVKSWKELTILHQNNYKAIYHSESNFTSIEESIIFWAKVPWLSYDKQFLILDLLLEIVMKIKRPLMTVYE